MTKKITTKEALSKLGSIGGKATLKKHGRKHFVKMAKLSNSSKKRKSSSITI